MLLGMLKFALPIFSPIPFQRIREMTLCGRVCVCVCVCWCVWGRGGAHFLPVSTAMAEADVMMKLVRASL